MATAFAYIIAYKYLAAYFHVLGCQWAIDLYPPTQLVQTAAPVAVVVAGLVFSIWNGYPSILELDPKLRAIAALATGALLCYLVHILIGKYAHSYHSYFNWPAFLLGYAAAATAVMKYLKAIFAAQGVALGSLFLMLPTAFGIFLFSNERGRAHAEETMGQENGRGAPVMLKDSKVPYRLARIVPYDRALVFSETHDGKRTFRIVAVADLSFVAHK
ncbi:TPA: hypothetical protein QDZ42_003976 [Stenotrophomonas maltophilia]|nr:hypothetical protein [Stenotrophomonas maltophilia]HDS1045290.1 hypothetical protein [Stenotrophomonas maltophilia]